MEQYTTPKLPGQLAPSAAEENAAEQVFVLALQNQDKKAFALLYDAYAPALYGTILHIVRSKPLAEDVLQECFVKIWTSFSLYDCRRGRLFTWIITIARHAAIDKLRGRPYLETLKNQNLEKTFMVVPLTTSYFYPEHIGLQEVTAQLRTEYKIIIDLLYFKGYTQAEVAQELSLPLGTIKTRTRKALQQLRSFF